MSTLEKLRRIPRAVRSIPVAGDQSIDVRDLTLAELRRVEARANLAPDGERGIRYATLLAALAIAEPDGSPAFAIGTDEELDLAAVEVEALLTPSQIKAVGEAAVEDRVEAKKN